MNLVEINRDRVGAPVKLNLSSIDNYYDTIRKKKLEYTHSNGNCYTRAHFDVNLFFLFSNRHTHSATHKLTHGRQRLKMVIRAHFLHNLVWNTLRIKTFLTFFAQEEKQILSNYIWKTKIKIICLSCNFDMNTLHLPSLYIFPSL